MRQVPKAWHVVENFLDPCDAEDWPGPQIKSMMVMMAVVSSFSRSNGPENPGNPIKAAVLVE